MNKLFTWLVPILLGIVGYFIIRTMNAVDEHLSGLDNKVDAISTDLRTVLGDRATDRANIDNNSKDIDRLNARVFSSAMNTRVRRKYPPVNHQISLPTSTAYVRPEDVDIKRHLWR